MSLTLKNLDKNCAERKMAELVLQKGLLPLFDANTSINQCHLIALFVVTVYAKVRAGGQVLDQEGKMLALCLLACPLIKSAQGLSTLYSIYAPPPSQGTPKREVEARRQESQALIKRYSSTKGQEPVKEALAEELFNLIRMQASECSELGPELVTLCDNQQLCINGQKLKTYPKYAGLLLFIANLRKMQEPPTIVVKLKSCTPEGSGLVIYQAKGVDVPLIPLLQSEEIDPYEPAIVVEGVSLPSPEVTLTHYEELTHRCPHQLLLRDRSLTHPIDARCVACTPRSVSREEEQILVGESLASILLKVGASYNRVYQGSLVEQLGSSVRQLYDRSLQDADKQGYAYTSNPRFVIEHIHPDTVREALANKTRLLDQAPDALLEKILGRIL